MGVTVIESVFDSSKQKEPLQEHSRAHCEAPPAAAIIAFRTPKVFSHAAGLAVMICNKPSNE